jgi:hypothetical protein
VSVRLLQLGNVDVIGPLVGQLAPGIAVLAGSLYLGFVLAIRLIEHRWPWPIGPRIGRRGTSIAFFVLPTILANVSISATRIAIELNPVIPSLSGRYVSDAPHEVWFSVYAPIDLAGFTVLAMPISLAAFLVGMGVSLALHVVQPVEQRASGERPTT